MAEPNTVIEGTVKFRDGKKWKSRWCVMRKLSPVADCLHLQLYRDSKDRYKQGQTKASLSLQHFLGIETGFTLDKESNTIAILCKDVTVVLAFDTRERLIQWQVKIATNLGEDTQFLVQITSAPTKAKISPGPARLHIQEYRFSITMGVPPRLVGVWDISKLRRYGVVESRFCFEGGSRCGKGEGLYVLVTDQGEEITTAMRMASDGKMQTKRRLVTRNMSVMDSPSKVRYDSRQLSTADTVSLTTLGDAASLAASISLERQSIHCGGGTLCSNGDIVSLNCHMSMNHHHHHRYCSCGDDSTLAGSGIWPSQETQQGSTLTDDILTDFGDTASLSAASHLCHNQDCSFMSDTRGSGGSLMNGVTGLGRCASCISKLGALSRSSTVTQPNTPLSGMPPGGNGLNGSTSPWALMDNMSISTNAISHCGGGGSRSLNDTLISAISCSTVSSHDSVNSALSAATVSSSTGSATNTVTASCTDYCVPKTPGNLPIDQVSNRCSKISVCSGMSRYDSCSSSMVSPPGRPPPRILPYADGDNPVSCNNMNCKCDQGLTSNVSNGIAQKRRKPPMPLPQQPCESSRACYCCQRQSANGQAVVNTQPTLTENYDVPKNFITPVKDVSTVVSSSQANGSITSTGEDYYDTPKRMKDQLIDYDYGNYDTPPSLVRPALVNGGVHNGSNQTETPPPLCQKFTNLSSQQLGSKAVISPSSNDDSGAVGFSNNSTSTSSRLSGSCPCHSQVMCWPSNWLPLPYCRRGTGIDHHSTTVHLHKVKLSGEGKMPVMNSVGEVAVYATVDMSKKAKYRTRVEQLKDQDKENHQVGASDNNISNSPSSNYVNVDIKGTSILAECNGGTTNFVNYENLEFAHSLEYYENARDLAGRLQAKDCVRVCNKCGHACSREPAILNRDNGSNGGDYLMMGPGGISNCAKPSSLEVVKYPGYLPMHPTRAASIPSLTTRKDSDRLSSSSATVRTNCLSANSSPYLRRHATLSSRHEDLHSQRNFSNQLSLTMSNEHPAIRKRSSSADSSRFEDETQDILKLTDSSPATVSVSKDPVEAILSQACIRIENVKCLSDEALVHVRRSSSVPSKSSSANRDSSSSNDSGVSTESFKARTTDFTDFELPLTTANSKRHYHAMVSRNDTTRDVRLSDRPHCIHGSLPRRSKSSDPLRELTFHFPRVRVPAKSSSAEAEIPICLNKHESKEYCSPIGDCALAVPYIDSRSTSSGTSDMSDYIETLSLSSHSSSDNPDTVRLGRIPATTLRPRSGKEYHKIDRYNILDTTAASNNGKGAISTVPEKSESPSPGYVSGSPQN